MTKHIPLLAVMLFKLVFTRSDETFHSYIALSEVQKLNGIAENRISIDQTFTRESDYRRECYLKMILILNYFQLFINEPANPVIFSWDKLMIINI